MTLKDGLETAAAALVLVSAVANLQVSMALRQRDRQDFERLRDVDFEQLKKEKGELEEKVASQGERIAKLEGPKK